MKYDKKLEEALQSGDKERVKTVLVDLISSKIYDKKRGEFYLKVGLATSLMQSEIDENYSESLEAVAQLMKELENQRQSCKDGDNMLEIKEKIIKDEL